MLPTLLAMETWIDNKFSKLGVSQSYGRQPHFLPQKKKKKKKRTHNKIFYQKKKDPSNEQRCIKKALKICQVVNLSTKQ